MENLKIVVGGRGKIGRLQYTRVYRRVASQSRFLPTANLQIHQCIPLLTILDVVLLNCESPSRIFFRLPHHITQKLQCTDRKVLKWAEAIEVGSYAMAPLFDDVFGRCQVVQCDANFVKVFFIDEATGKWIRRKDLYELPREFAFVPWQSIEIALARVQPRDSKTWTREDCDVLQNILNKFKQFRLTAVEWSPPRSKQKFWADITGMEEIIEGSDVDIASLLAMQQLLVRQAGPIPAGKRKNFAVAEDVERLDGPEEPPVDDERGSDSEELEATDGHESDGPDHPRRKLVAISGSNSGLEEDECSSTCHRQSTSCSNSTSELSISLVDPNEAWRTENCHVRIDLQRLENFRYKPSSYLMCVLGVVVSPYEFYVYPLDASKGCVEANNEMLQAAEENAQFGRQLDHFYQQISNRRPLSEMDITALLDRGEKIYGIYQRTNAASGSDGRFLRVEVLACRPKTVLVRRLDAGGTNHIPIGSLFKIHKSHTRRPPFCLPVCLTALMQTTGMAEMGWDAELKELWVRCIRGCPLLLDNFFVKSVRNARAACDDENLQFLRGDVVLTKKVFGMRTSESLEDLVEKFVDESDGRAAYSSTSISFDFV